MASGFIDPYRMILGWWSKPAGSAERVNYSVQSGQCYVPGARAGQVVPNSVSADSYMPGATEGDVE